MEGDSMIEITEQEFEDRKDYYCDKAESGTVILAVSYTHLTLPTIYSV